MSNDLTENNNNQVSTTSDDNEAHALTTKETREILTPFAFEIDKTLYGTQLALPSKRGIAILIDLMLIAILSGAPGELLAIVLAMTLYRLGSNSRAEKLGKTKGRKRRKFMRFIAAFTLFVTLSSVLPPMFESAERFTNGSADKGQTSQNTRFEQTSFSDTIKFTAAMTNAIAKLSTDKCSKYSCWQEGLLPSVKILNDVNLPIKDKQALVESLVTETNLPPAEVEQLKSSFLQALTKGQTPSQTTSDETEVIVDAGGEQSELISESKIKQPVYSFVELAKGIIHDLGLGFGWAAFYFTVFTALWKGQTPGKKLMGIQVVQLDGTPLSMWDSFGRYGGYGAGIATGLLGFAQIFWDANRQAIHDKISATVVIAK